MDIFINTIQLLRFFINKFVITYLIIIILGGIMPIEQFYSTMSDIFVIVLTALPTQSTIIFIFNNIFINWVNLNFILF